MIILNTVTLFQYMYVTAFKEQTTLAASQDIF